jgi:hypothetical protein
MQKTAILLVVLHSVLLCPSILGQRRVRPRRVTPKPRPVASVRKPSTTNPIDVLIRKGQQRKGIQPAELCTEEIFVRRVYLDVIGTLPEPEEIRIYFKKRRLDKRSTLINELLRREEFADYWALKWCDLLRVKAEFPINLWPNAVQAYHRWIRDAIAENLPYDEFARALLCSSGSNFRVPPVNFYRAVQGQEPATLARAVALTFMGTRLDQFTQDHRAGMETFFSHIAFKGTAEWKEEIVFLDPQPRDDQRAVFPDGSKATIRSDQDPRMVFADWLIAPGNPWFARAIVNRIWAWLFGRGIIHEPDDIRPDNPGTHPAVLAYLEQELVKSKYDLQHIFRLILTSQTYQQSPIARRPNEEAEAYFACYPVRRLDAEVLIDALCRISGTKESYSSMVPEPFTFIPEEHRSIELADGSITSQFLEMFGRPARDTGLFSERNNQPSQAQRLHLLNSSHVQTKIERGPRLKGLLKTAKKDRTELVRTIYLTILSRYPNQQEFGHMTKYYQTKGITSQQATTDLVWALINSKEFLYRH